MTTLFFYYVGKSGPTVKHNNALLDTNIEVKRGWIRQRAWCTTKDVGGRVQQSSSFDIFMRFSSIYIRLCLANFFCYTHYTLGYKKWKSICDTKFLWSWMLHFIIPPNCLFWIPPLSLSPTLSSNFRLLFVNQRTNTSHRYSKT